MSDVIDFLEKLGQDSALRHASLDSVLAQARLSPEVRAALASRDAGALAALLGSANVCCLINAPQEERGDEPARKVQAPSGNVCCMVFAPLEEEQEESSPKQAAA